MNIFRLAGDMTHLLSILVLLLKIHATRSCRGTLWRLLMDVPNSHCSLNGVLFFYCLVLARIAIDACRAPESSGDA